jgi:hypothetical protein
MALIAKAKTLTQLQSTYRFKGVIQGASFTGKSSIGLEFPRPICVIDAEKSIDKYSMEGADDIYVFQPTAITNPKYNPDNYDQEDPNAEHPGVTDILNDLLNDPQGIKTVIVDSITVIEDMFTNVVLDANKRAALKQGDIEGAMLTKIELNQYNLLKLKAKQSFQALTHLDCNVIVNAHEKSASFMKEGAAEEVPLPEANKSIIHFFDEHIRLTKQPIFGKPGKEKREMIVLKARGNFPEDTFPYSITGTNPKHTFEQLLDLLDPNRTCYNDPKKLDEDSILHDMRKATAKSRTRSHSFTLGERVILTAGLNEDDFKSISKIAKANPKVKETLEETIPSRYGVNEIFDLSADEGKDLVTYLTTK